MKILYQGVFVAVIFMLLLSSASFFRSHIETGGKFVNFAFYLGIVGFIIYCFSLKDAD